MRGLEYEPETQTALQDAIGALPSTPDGIAAEFYASGITGRPCSPSRCAVAAYLRGKLPDLDVAAGTVTATVLDAGKAVASVNLPEPVAEFVDRFDSGAYPELMEAP